MKIQNTLHLPLKRKWFEMTKAGIKTEDYRDITPYWANRFLGQSKAFWKGYLGYNSNNKRCYGFKDQSSIDFIIAKCKGFKNFTTNSMTLGYPKSTDTDRILKLEHKGIEIRTGNHEWGAEPGKLYFVIKHGKIISDKEDVWQISDRPFCEYPIGTKAQAQGGGYWIKNDRGWKWCTGSTFTRPGGDWNGMISLP